MKNLYNNNIKHCILFANVLLMNILFTNLLYGQTLNSKTLGGTYDIPVAIKVVNGEKYILGIASKTFVGKDYNGTYTGGDYDMFVTKLDKSENIVYTRYIRASNVDVPVAMEIENDEVYILGYTNSNNFPVTDTSKFNQTGNWDMTITKLNTTGQVVFARYLGGNRYDIPKDLQVENGEMYITGETTSNNFPVTDGSKLDVSYYPWPDNPASDIIVTKLNTNGSIVYSRYSGTNNVDVARFIQVENGEAYFTTESFGWSYGNNLLTKVTKLNVDGSTAYVHNFNQSYWQQVTDMKLSNGEVYIAINDYSYNTSFTKLNQDGSPAYISQFNLTNNYSTSNIQVVNGELYFATRTNLNTFPVTDASKNHGNLDILVAKLNTSGNINYGTYIGGKFNDYIQDIKVENDKIYLLGATQSNDFPITNQTQYVAYTDYYLYNYTITMLDADKNIEYSSFIGNGQFRDLSMDVANTSIYIVSPDSIEYTKYDPCSDFPASNDTIEPITQATCIRGLVKQLVGSKITLPAVTHNGSAVYENNTIEAKYQWQVSDSIGGPWKNIVGSVLRNYTPQADTINKYYRRIAHKGAACEFATVSISPVASIIVNSHIAPVVDAGGLFYTCPGTLIQIGGPITAQGGAPPYKYEWDNGANPEPNPHVRPNEGTTIYRLTVSDTLGCKNKSQAIVYALDADAGPEKLNTCDKNPVLIGAPLKSYPMLTATYHWASEYFDDPLYGMEMDGEFKAQPMVNPDKKTNYTLEYTVFATNGGFCSTTDVIEITPIKRPKGIGIDSTEFAGRDTILCFAASSKIGLDLEKSKEFKYLWSPGGYLSSDSIQEPIFDPGNLALPTPNPIKYYLIAQQKECFYVDTVKVSVIEANTGVGHGDCSTLLGRGDRTPAIQDTFIWTKLYGEGNILSNPKLPQITVDRGAAQYELNVKYNNKSCKDQITINESPTCHCTFDIIGSSSCPKYDPNDSLAGKSSLSATLGGPYVFTWEPHEGISGYDKGTGQTVWLTDTIERTYTVTAHNPYDNDKCSASIHVNNPYWSKPKFKAKEFRVKMDSIINIGDEPAVPGYNYLWEGDGLSCYDCPNPELKVIKIGKYPVKVSDVTGCDVRDTVNVFVKLADAGPDKIVCEIGQTVQIGTLGNNDYEYSWEPANANWANGTNNSSPQPYVAVSDSVMNFVLTVTDPLTGDFDTDEVEIKVAGAGFTDHLDREAGICKGNELIIGRFSESGTTYQWNPTDGLQSPNESSTVAKPDKFTAYTLTATYPGGCVTTQKYFVHVIDPSFSLRDTIFCPSNGPVHLGNAAPANMFSYSWTPADSVSDPTIQNPTTLDPPPNGITTFSLLVQDKAGCYANSKIKITSSTPIPNAGEDVTICKGSGSKLGHISNLGTEKWSITSGPDTSMTQLSCTTCAQPMFTPSSEGIYEIYASQTESGCTASAKVIITVNDFTLPELSSKEICAGNSVTIGNYPVSNVTYSWSPITGLSDANIAQPTSTPGATITYTLTATSTAGVCTGSTTVKATTVTVNPLPTFTLSDKTFCPSGAAVPLGVDAPAGMTTYYWSPNYLVTNSSIQNPSTLTPPPGIKSNYILQITDNKGCKAKDTITITPTVLPDAGANRTMCKNANEIIGSSSNTGSIVWSITSGPNSSISQLSCTSCAQPVFTPTGSGNYIIKITITSGGCTNSSSVYISVYDFALPTLTSPSVCAGSSVVIGTYATSDNTYSWSPTTGLSDPNIAQPTANPGVTTTYTVTVKAISGACAGSTTTGNVTVTVNPLPAFTLANKTYCPSDGRVSLGDLAPSGMSAYNWSPAGKVTNSNIQNPSTLTPPPGVATTYTLEVTDNKGCKGNNTITVTPVIVAPIAGKSLNMCAGVSEYIGDASNLNTDTWSITSAPDTSTSQLSCLNCSEPLFTPSSAGIYLIKVSRTIGGCTSTSGFTAIVSSFTLQALSSPTICLGNSVQIGPNPVSGTQYFWSPTTGLSSSIIANPIATVTTSTLYTLYAVGNNGCPVTANVSVLVNSLQAPVINIPDVTVEQGALGVKFLAEVNPSGTYDYLWSPNNGTLSNIYLLQPNVLVSNIGTKTYSLTVTNTQSGCSNTANVTLTTLDASKALQTITFGTIASKTMGDAPFSLSATTSSGLAISYSSSDTNVAIITGNIVTIVGAGTSIITASQAGNADYNPATDVSNVLTVEKAPQTITFGLIANKTLGDPPFTLIATASSGIAVIYSSSNTSVVTIIGNVATIHGAGTVAITVAQPGNANYYSASSVDQTFCILPAKPVISITGNAASPTLTSSSSVGNQWYLNDVAINGATNQTFIVEVSGVYFVKVKADNCESIASNEETIVLTGVSLAINSQNVVVYPNPVKDKLVVVLNGFNVSKKVKIKIADCLGASVKNITVNGEKEITIDVSSFAIGVYVLKITQQDISVKVQFIKE